MSWYFLTTSPPSILLTPFFQFVADHEPLFRPCNQSQPIGADHANGGPPGPMSVWVPSNGLGTYLMGMCWQGLHICVLDIYKRACSPDPSLTFWLTHLNQQYSP